MTHRIRTARQARTIREGIHWGRLIMAVRKMDNSNRERVTQRALDYAKARRSNLMATAISRTAFRWMYADSLRAHRERV